MMHGQRRASRAAIIGGRGMADHQIFEQSNFLLQKGAVLPIVRLAYKTLGELNAARDNAVLVPTWYTGTHNDIETFMLGETRALDPRRFHHHAQPARKRPVVVAQQHAGAVRARPLPQSSGGPGPLFPTHRQ
jgi:hypothetical protein